jgi:hypothetical protein
MYNNNKFQNYNLLDFVLDDDFNKWVLSPDTDDDLFWISWISNNPEKESMIDDAKEIILSFKVSSPQISDREIRSIVDDTIAKINAVDNIAADEEVPMPEKSKSLLYWLSGIAASLIIGVLGTYFYAKKADKSIYEQLVASNTVALTEQYNSTGKPLIIKLEDGSYVTLQNKSRLSFPKTFMNKNSRSVYLNGAAFFSVAKNPAKPFLVYANGIVTKVLGTRFKINSFDTDKKAVVEVISGIVSVNSFNLKNAKPEKSNEKESGVILTRNQKAIYGTDNHRLEASIIENPQLADSTLNLRFVDTNIKHVLNSVKQLYGIEIIYDEKMVTGKTLTGDLTNTTMYQKLDVICKILNCHYEIIDRNIYINQER